MLGVSGRTLLALVLCLGLVGVLVLMVGHAGLGRGETALAREAVTQALRQLPPAPASFEPPVRGRVTTPDESAGMDKAVQAFLGAIRDGKGDAAWEMVDPKLTGGLDKDQWSQQFGATEQDRRVGRGMEETMGLLMGQKSRVAEVHTEGESGTARIIVTIDAPLWLGLVRRGDAWALDLQRSADLQAFHDVGKQLATLQSDDADSFFKAIIGMQGGASWNDYLSLLVLAPEGARHEIVARSVDGEQAVVRVQGHADIHLAVPLQREGQGWIPEWDSGLEIIKPEAQLTEAGGAIAPRPGPRSAACMSNVKQIMLAMLMYCQDYDEKMPMANKWSDETYPYTKNQSIYCCPSSNGKPGYAMNYKLSRLPLAKLGYPGETVALFDSTLLRPNAYDVGKPAGASVTWPPRHDGLIVYGYADGHVRAERSPLAYPYWYQVSGPKRAPNVPDGPPGGGPGAPPPDAPRGGK